MRTFAVADILTKIRENGARMSLDNDQLRISAPRGTALPAQLLEKIKTNKAEIVDFLKREHLDPGEGMEDDIVWFEEPKPGMRSAPGEDGSYAVMHNQEKEFIRYRIVGPYGFNLLLRMQFGHFDKGVIARVIETVFLRHESLRTTYMECEGEVRQVVQPYPMDGFQIQYIDLTGDENREGVLGELMAGLPKLKMDFEKGPLVDVKIVQMAPESNILLFTIHHVICDEVSLGILRRELTVLYEACLEHRDNPLHPVRMQYKEYARWVKDYLESEKGELSKRYYVGSIGESIRRELRDSGGEGGGLSYRTQLERELKTYLKTDEVGRLLERARGLIVNIYTQAGGTYISYLHGPQLKKLKATAVRHRSTPFCIVLSLLAMAFYRVKGRKELRIYIPYNARIFEPFEEIVGWLVGNSIVCFSVDEQSTPEKLIPVVERAMEEASYHRFYPYEKLMEEMDVTLDLLSPVQVNFIKEKGTIKDFTPSHDQRSEAHFDFRCSISDKENGIQFFSTYKLAKYSPGEIEAMFRVIQELLHDML